MWLTTSASRLLAHEKGVYLSVTRHSWMNHGREGRTWSSAHTNLRGRKSASRQRGHPCKCVRVGIENEVGDWRTTTTTVREAALWCSAALLAAHGNLLATWTSGIQTSSAGRFTTETPCLVSFQRKWTSVHACWETKWTLTKPQAFLWTFVRFWVTVIRKSGFYESFSYELTSNISPVNFKTSSFPSWKKKKHMALHVVLLIWTLQRLPWPCYRPTLGVLFCDEPF